MVKGMAALWILVCYICWCFWYVCADSLSSCAHIVCGIVCVDIINLDSCWLLFVYPCFCHDVAGMPKPQKVSVNTDQRGIGLFIAVTDQFQNVLISLKFFSVAQTQVVQIISGQMYSLLIHFSVYILTETSVSQRHCARRHMYSFLSQWGSGNNLFVWC